MGFWINGEVKNAINIPFALSILAHLNPNAEVIGLDQFPNDEIPPLYIHYLFDIMVTIGMFMLLIVSCLLDRHLEKMAFCTSQIGFKWLIVLGGPLAILAIEAGWWLDEVGRQPWILRGIMKTLEASHNK